MSENIMNDPYFKLRPEPPTPEDELCACEKISEIYLCYRLGSNPVYCMECNGEVLPDKLACGERLAEAIAFWNSVSGSLYLLWLHSGEYEQWARDRLLDPRGEVNTRGIEIAKQLGSIAKTYYWWFSESPETAPKACPLCGAELVGKKGSKFLLCEHRLPGRRVFCCIPTRFKARAKFPLM